ncbi:uncharacterized protein LOC118744846 [Rhagoletis pomonella]|uniref:uncharacterized protein LOC118744846 n=1 Tax=Rhagoletis pomonella TaxID=28610 RepID=UPI00177CB1F9|nr:uncharacterized protein LOC118744846 [Rhagoletis pomonella]
MKLFIGLVVAVFFICACADVSHILHHSVHETTPQPGPPNPYVFSYQAGRAPGHVDRQHTEVSDGTGVVRGAFSYVDPKNQLRTVQYVADKHGFHPQLSHEQEDTEAVKQAKRKHFALYNRIAQEHAADGGHGGHEAYAAGPRNTEAVAYATHKHLSEYERIAAEHARMRAELEAQRLNSPQDDGQYHGEEEQLQHY